MKTVLLAVLWAATAHMFPAVAAYDVALKWVDNSYAPNQVESWVVWELSGANQWYAVASFPAMADTDTFAPGKQQWYVIWAVGDGHHTYRITGTNAVGASVPSAETTVSFPLPPYSVPEQPTEFQASVYSQH